MLEDSTASAQYTHIAAKLKARFAFVFWNPQRECLFDVVGNGGADDSIRPNQIFAIGLPYPLISGALARQTVATVEKELLTPFGMRSLAVGDRNYQGTYQGDVASRDGAYHQGTVWPWLIGAFFRAKLAVNKPEEAVYEQIDQWLGSFAAHLEDAGLEQVSEVFYGNYPHTPRGCIAQAWSVAEILNLAAIAAKRSTGNP